MSARDDIISKMKTVLEGITIAGGYQTDIGTVYDRPMNSDLLDRGVDFPCIDMTMGQESVTYYLQNTADFTFPILLRLYVLDDGSSPTNKRTQINNLHEDVYKVLYQDPYLDGKAISVIAQDADPPRIWDASGPIGIEDITVSVKYRRDL